jgi:hypothetical protein
VSKDFHKRHAFFGMQSNQRSESLNSVLHNHLDRKMSLVDLVEHYEFRLSALVGMRLSLMRLRYVPDCSL